MSSNTELLGVFHEAVTRLNLCPNRVWAVAGEDLPKLLPRRRPTSTTVAKPQGREDTSNDSHELCTFDFCEVSQRDFTAVQQRHECNNSKEGACMQTCGRFLRTILERAAENDRSTVWNLAGSGMLRHPRPYMALSHVWSDGTGAGAWKDGQVNECLYNYFRGIAQQFDCEGIWWDTICIPSGKAARTKAIRKIQTNYLDSRFTLVHDCFLRDWEWDPETACFGILMSPWFSRGWTALELANSRKVKVIFKGRHGPVFKDLDQEILAKDDDPEGPRKEASRLIWRLRSEVNTLNDLLTVLSPRCTSWPKDMAVISALLVGVRPQPLQQDTYKTILKRLGRIAPGHLFHNTATMSEGFGWCPVNLFTMPLDPSEASLIISENGSLQGSWLVYGENALPGEIAWHGIHALIRRRIESVLGSHTFRLLAEPNTTQIERALVVKTRPEEKKQTICSYEYVGAVHFQQRLPVNNWLLEEVIVCGNGQDRNAGVDNVGKGKTLNGSKPEEVDDPKMLHDAIWKGDHIRFRELIQKVDPDAPDQLGRRPLHLAVERGDKLMVQSLMKRANLDAECHHGQTPLHTAVWGGSVSILEMLLGQKSNVNVRDKDGNTPLHIAARMGFQPIAEILLHRAGGNAINAKGCNGLTPVHYAALHGHEDVVQFLLQQGADVNIGSDSGWTSLHYAAANVHGEAVLQQLLNHGADMNCESDWGWEPLHCAAASGNGKAATVLIKQGATVNLRDSVLGWTPLHVAAMNGSNQVVSILLEKGANRDTEDSGGWTPTCFAHINRHFETRELLTGKSFTFNFDLIRGRQWSLLHFAAIEGQHNTMEILFGRRPAEADGQTRDHRPEVFTAKKGLIIAMQRLLLCGGNIEERSGNRTLLSLAAENGHGSFIQLLIEKGLDIDAEDRAEKTPLGWAASRGHSDVVEILLDNDFGIDAPDSSNQTPLCRAAENGHYELVKLLLERGAKPGGVDEYQWPVWLAAKGDHRDVVQLLLDNGADIESSDRLGRTALCQAAIDGREDTVRFLLEKGADIETTEDFGQTPLMKVVKDEKEAMVRLLLDKGAKVEAEDDRGMTALMIAAQVGSEAMVKLLIEEGADLQSEDDVGETALAKASSKGNMAVVRLLLEKGAYLLSTHRMTGRALVVASGKGYMDIAQLLLENGADIETQDVGGKSALIIAAENGREAIVRVLLSRGAHVDARDRYSGDTALMRAASGGHGTIVELLLDHGAEIEAFSNNERTPLSFAAEFAQETCVQILLDRGAQAHPMKPGGGFPRDMPISLARGERAAAPYDHERVQRWGRILRLLIDAGSRPRARK